ncbi:hypothetical protein BT63DRAFT_376661 [Microthyrium microscopicum]|uniref:Uncharacterized protein n=1 Tax=Microthyrium microscopicum TaxID=703497 RepID=A0A6A6U5I3_9PEZI|nr:hypothetical protein BT63DRAFT_376661 [Microthyrium microscopicum]
MIPQGISQAKDGSVVLDTTAMINNLPIRYRVSAPAAMFKAASGVPGAAAAPDATSPMGMNVLLHGDGGASFVAYPNQGVQNNLMGVTVLAPDPNLFWGGGQGLKRTMGVQHAQAVNDLVQKEMPKMVAFNMSNVYFTGVSGGSLMMSGFFIPAQMKNFPNTGVLLMCGALAPQVPFQDMKNVITSTTIHYQSTTNELANLQMSIPQAVSAYEAMAKSAGMTPEQIGKMQTIDNTPQGGHCEFDSKGFNSGIQLVQNSYKNIMQPGATGQVTGIQTNVLKTVVGNEKPTFGKAPRRLL